MAWSQDHKAKTRQKILSSASKLFTRDGFDHVGINDVMKDAGMTRGAFYAHFESKAGLYAESIIASAIKTGKKIDARKPDAISMDQLVKAYLSQEHREGGHYRCPLAFLTTDISQRDEQVRDAYTKVFKGFVRNLTKHRERLELEADATQSLQQAVMMIGGLAIARAINDDGLADDLLLACQDALKTTS